MKHKKKITFLGALFVVFIAIISLFNITQNNIEARSTIDNDVLNHRPFGIPLDDYFYVPTNFTTGEANNAKTYGSDDPKKSTTVILTDGKSNTSSVWSDGDNYIDMNKKQTLSMWMYFGANMTYKGAADGLAFVLQNDKNGTKAISTLNGKVNRGESLGVWGSDGSKLVTNDDTPLKGDNTTPIQNQAIQNSWALELDTYSNKGTGKTYNGYQIVPNPTGYDMTNGPMQIPNAGDAFDWLPYRNGTDPIGGSHIAWNYPARKDTYQQISSDGPKATDVTIPFIGTNTIYSGTSVMAMKHNFGTDSGDNGNNVDFTYNSGRPPIESWKHLSITYTPPTVADPKHATIHYEFNDKDAYGKIIQNPRNNTQARGTASVEVSAFGEVPGGKLRYGFTGSTGSDAETTSAVIFETMPSLVEADTNSYAVDKDTHARVGSDTSLMDTEAQSMSETKKVHPGDNIGLNYMMYYDSGKQPSKDVVATVDVPDNLTIKNDDGNIGTVYYSDTIGSKTKEVAINESSLAADGKSVSVNIEDLGVADGSKDNWKTARIELNTTANKPDSGKTLTVPPAHAVFEGSNYKSDTEIPTFDIVAPVDTLVLAKTSGDGTYSSTTKEIDLNGSIKYNTTPANVDKTSTWYTYKIDNQAPVTTQDTLTQDANKFSIPITGLTEGDHKITVKASSTLNNDVISSNEITYNVTIQSMMITNKAQVYDESQSRYITDGDTVQEGDKLQYQYNVSYDGGTTDLLVPSIKSSLPDNLSGRKLGIYPGTAYYTTYEGVTEEFPFKNIGSPPFTYDVVLDLGNNNPDDNQAGHVNNLKLVYYMTANDVDKDTKVNAITATVSSGSYSGSMDTPSFTIRNAEYKPHLEATDDSDMQSVTTNDDFTLKGLVTYFTNDDSHTKTDFKNSEMTTYARIDGNPDDDNGFEKVGSLSDTDSPGVFTILHNASELGNGVHYIYVRVLDKYGNVSNTVDYEIRVGDKVLAVTPDKRNITVEDGLPVTLSGVYKHTDGSELEGDQINIQYLIHSENTAFDQKQQTVTYDTGYQSGDKIRKFSFDINPVGYARSPSYSYDKWLDTMQNGINGKEMPVGLRIGKNIVDVILTDTAGHSVKTTYTINVPEDNLELTSDNTDFTILSNGELNLPLTVKYEKSFNVTSIGSNGMPMLIHIVNPKGGFNYSSCLDSVDSQSTSEFTTKLFQGVIGNILGIPNDSAETGIGPKHVISYYVEDLYGRKSNTVEANVKWVSKSATLTSNTDYKFNAVNKSAEKKVVKRNGKWTLGVDSVQSAWDLTASAEPMTTKDVAGNILTLPGNLIFVDKDNNSFSMDSDTPIASDPDVDSENVDIAGKWSDNDGILLNLTGEPEAGTYSTKISWTLSNTL